MGDSYNPAKELRHVQNINCIKAAISRSLQGSARMLFKQSVRETEKTIQNSSGNESSKIITITRQAASPLVTGGIDSVLMLNAYKNYLISNKELRDTLKGYSEDGTLNALEGAMVEAGALNKGEHIEVQAFNLNSIVNRGTIVRDQLTGKMRALNDFTELEIKKTVDTASGKTGYRILKDGKVRATVSQAVVDAWVNQGRVSEDLARLSPKEGQLDISGADLKFTHKRVGCRVKGGNVYMINVNSGANAERYRTFLALARRRNGSCPDKIPKVMMDRAKRLEKMHRRAEKARRMLSAGNMARIPKRFLRSWRRLAIRPLGQSDTMKGADIARSIMIPAGTVLRGGSRIIRKHLLNPAVNTVYNLGAGQARLRRALRIKAEKGISFRASLEQAEYMTPHRMVRFSDLNRKNAYLSGLKNDLRHNIRMRVAKLFGGSGNMALRSLSDRAFIKETARRAGLSRDAVSALIDADRRVLMSTYSVLGADKGRRIPPVGAAGEQKGLKEGSPLLKALRKLIEKDLKKTGHHNAGETLPSYLKDHEGEFGSLFDVLESPKKGIDIKDAVQDAADSTRRHLMGTEAGKRAGKAAGKPAGDGTVNAAGDTARHAQGAAHNPAVKAITAAGNRLKASAAKKGAGAAARSVEASAKGAVGAAKTGAQTMQTAIEAVKAAAAAFTEFLQAAAAFIAEFWWVILIAVMVLSLLAFLWMVMVLAVKQEEDIATEVSRFQSTNRMEWEDYSKRLMDELRNQHELEMELIEGLMDDYPVTDVQYPSGERENYKELFAAMEIEIQYDPDCIAYDELEDIAKRLYKRTHAITLCPYTFYDDDGTEREACHIYVNIQRGDALCYEDLYVETDEDGICSAGARAGITGAGNVGYLYTPSVTVQNDDWIDIVQSVKQALSATGCYYYNAGDNRLDNDEYVTINVNGTPISVRPDCSGFISACLYLYGATDDPDAYTSASLTMASSLPGFYVQKFKGWDALKPGDIIAKKGHCEVFAGSSGGNNYVWNCGSDYSVSQPGETTSATSVFMTVLRPYSEVSALSPVAPPLIGAGPSLSGMAALYTGTDVTGYDSDSIYPYTSAFSEDDYYFPLSNTAGITVDPQTLCETGYDMALNATLEAEMASSEHFTAANYEDGMADHTLTEAGSPATSSDFVRYILAKHGVQFEMDDWKSVFNHVEAPPETAQAGCVIFYVPSTAETNKLKGALKDGDFRRTGGELAREVKAPDGSMMNIGETLYKCTVPMICTGNGTAVAYSRDLQAYDYLSTDADIREYPVSDLDKTRILNTELFTGYTAEPVFGSTPFFEGWTNENVACLIEIISDDCWETGEKRFAEDDPSGNDDFSIDYSWYDPGSDQFEGNAYFVSDEHRSTFEDEMLTLFIKHYDEYGILPSYGYAYAATVTKDRSTEESLTHNNIFELLMQFSTESGAVEKFEYEDDGDAVSDMVSYRNYGSFFEALSDYYAYVALKCPGMGPVIRGSGFDLSGDPIDLRYEDFASQYGQFVSEGLCSPEDAPLVMDKYLSGQGTYDACDAIAVERNGYIVELNGLAKRVSDLNDTIDSWEYNDISTYDELLSEIKQLEATIRDLEWFDHDTEYKYVTPKEELILEDAIDAIESAWGKAWDLYDYYSMHQNEYDGDPEWDAPDDYDVDITDES